MKPFRVSIATSLGAIAVIAVGLMGMREGTVLWAFLAFLLTVLFLIGATLITLLRPAERRAGWTGFAVVGWIYFLLNFGPWHDATPPPRWDGEMVQRLMTLIHPPARDSRGEQAELIALELATIENSLNRKRTGWSGNPAHFYQSVHSLGTLLFGAIGAAWARWLVRRPSPRTDRRIPTPEPQDLADAPTESST